jgi:H+/Cl- antiporter ClcA
MTAPDQPAAPDGRAILRLVVLGAVVGLPAAVVAALFLALVHYFEHWLWVDLPDALGETSPPWYLILGLPIVGAGLVGAIRLVLPGDGGHTPLEGLRLGPIRLADAPGVALAGLASLAFGAVLGPEAPVVALGAAVAVAVTSFAGLGDKERQLLALAGAFAAISALFGGPLVGGVMLLEAVVGLGTAAIPSLLPGFVAAAVGYLIFVGFGDWGGLDSPGLAVPDLPTYTGTHLLDLIVAIAVGLATALLIIPLREAAALGRRRVESRLAMPLVLLAGGAAVGAIALVADAAGSDSQDVFFSGQASIPSLLASDSTRVVLVLLVAKALAYAISLACGFRGGPIFPAIFLGIALATLPVVWFDLSPTVAVAIGAAAGMAAQSKLFLSSMLFASLLVGLQGVDAIPAAVLASAASWLCTSALEARRPAAAQQAAGAH